MAGRVLGGRYTVQDRIGTGGMAIVYRGLDEVLGRTVAIKTMLPQYANDPSFTARFKQEAQAAAALQSPYIVSVYDWGKDGDTYYIVMEYLRGTDLKSGIRKHGALECRKVAQIGSQIAQALSVAHRHDIIHRDIKPQNIMVLRDGNVKVMDFGIARAKNSHLTTDNSVLGTAHYVSPEQTQGKELGPTTDIYSLGIVMYEAATGKVPFEGDDAISVALKQVNEQPKPPSQINPKVDPSLEAIILKCMQKDPAARFQTADELYHVLRDYMAGRYQIVNREIDTQVINPAVTTVDPIRTITPDQTSRQDKTRAQKRVKPRTANERAKQQAEERARKARRRRTLTIVGFLLLLALVGAAAALYFSNANATQSVPNLLNYTQTEALRAIDDSNFFQRGEVTSEWSTTVDEGKVISQSPASGKRAERGTKIDLVISKGEEPRETVSVPDLKGKTPLEAQALLSERGLVGEQGDPVYDDNIENGKVATQDPAAETLLKQGDTVTYCLSKGKETVEVPSVVGDSLEEAQAALEQAGLVAEVDYDNSDTYAYGYIMEQSKTGTAEKGSTVRIIMSLGKATVDVPDVVGSTQDVAYSTLTQAGFSVTVETATSDQPSGTVIAQDPSGTIESDASKNVTITVSSGPATPAEDDTTDTGDDTSQDSGQDSGDDTSQDSGQDSGGDADSKDETGDDTGTDSETESESGDDTSSESQTETGTDSKSDN